jgi:hypothetical protein
LENSKYKRENMTEGKRVVKFALENFRLSGMMGTFRAFS